MDFESDPAAEFLNREKEMLGELENEISTTNDEQANSGPTSDDFVIVNENDVQQHTADNEIEDAFVGMQLHKAPPKEEPEKIRLWKERQAQLLEEKDHDEEEAIKRLKDSAREELSDWYKRNQANLDQTKANNRLNESSRSDSTASDAGGEGEAWKGVYNLCDFSQQKACGSRDRMKNILLQLNQTPLKNA